MRSAVRRNSPIRRKGFALIGTTRVFQPCTSLAYRPSERRIRTARGRAAHLYSPVCLQGDASGSRGCTPSSEHPTGRSISSPHKFMGCRSRSASLPARRDGRNSRTAASQPMGCRTKAGVRNVPHSKRCPSLAPVPFSVGVSGCMAVGTSSYRVRTIAGVPADLDPPPPPPGPNPLADLDPPHKKPRSS